jgi:hypothetical protein
MTMRPRLPGFGFTLCTSLLLASGCGAAGSLKLGSAEASSAPAVAAPGTPGAQPQDVRADAGAVADAARREAPEPMPAPPPPDHAVPPASPTEPAPMVTTPSREMLDIEANVMLQVNNVRHSVKALRDLAARTGGVVTSERVDSASRYGSAELTLRIPSRATETVFDDLQKLGSVLNQTVTARDIGKEFFDANLRLSNLNATRSRYEEILSKATKVEEILRIEQELSRLRAEIEQVKGDLRWLSDRAARATLHVSLRERQPEVAYTDEPEPKFYPGLRAPLLLDFGRSEERLHAGGGISVRFARSFSLDLDILRRFGSDERGPDALVATAGGETYSDLLGDGERRFLNPYLGFRAGYAGFAGHHQALVGGTAGVELFKNRWFDLDLETRHYLAFGGDLGAHYVLVPALSASLAF